MALQVGALRLRFKLHFLKVRARRNAIMFYGEGFAMRPSDLGSGVEAASQSFSRFIDRSEKYHYSGTFLGSSSIRP